MFNPRSSPPVDNGCLEQAMAAGLALRCLVLFKWPPPCAPARPCRVPHPLRTPPAGRSPGRPRPAQTAAWRPAPPRPPPWPCPPSGRPAPGRRRPPWACSRQTWRRRWPAAGGRRPSVLLRAALRAVQDEARSCIATQHDSSAVTCFCGCRTRRGLESKWQGVPAASTASWRAAGCASRRRCHRHCRCHLTCTLTLRRPRAAILHR